MILINSKNKKVENMHILLTNDDGIYAPGIYALYLELKKIGRVTVVAPDGERSAVGHGITLSHPLWHKKIHRKNKFFGHGISGTPADCVKFATSVLLKNDWPDVVVSGVNLGPNDGCSVIYSGTVAGAREGAILDIPSIAISLDSFVDSNFSYASKCGAKLVKKIVKHGMSKGTFLNVNVPNKKAPEIKGVKVTRQCMIPIHGVFKKRKDPSLREYYWMTAKHPVKKSDLSFDTYALNHGYVTVTPIACDTTDTHFLQNLQGWKI
ncbi:5'-nucleotidase SurE [hydrothermal vent metagenome]|uniref:5'-nucleotidase SurE n=1 Tax=hydrothermal vent metagenome TaxID=652676 RepID=A0A3B1DIU7_9ZZZZ